MVLATKRHGTTPPVALNADWQGVLPGRLELRAWSENGSAKKVRGRRNAAGFFAVLAILFMLGVSPAAAAVWFVDGTFGNDGNSCTAPTLGACRTIQAAINKASPNDTINVAAGVYPEAAPGPLTVNKTLTLLGAQNGVDARGRIGAESVVTDSQGTSVSASNVIIDGFTFRDSINAAFTGFGIWLNPGISGTQILNNIIQNNIVGIGLANSSSSQALIKHNQIENNNQPGGASGTGIYTDQFVGGPIVQNVLIAENTFVGNGDAGIDVSNTDPTGGVFNLEASANVFDGNGRAALLFNTHMSTVHNNSITNSTLAGSAAIRLFDNNTNLTITFNDLMTGAGHAIRLSFLGFVGGPSSNVVINENNIGFVGPISFVLDGLKVDSGSYNGTVNAECNWWGSATGPTNVNNPGGTGEEVEGNADFTPWLIAPAPGGSCGITPGKVTGGGQIDSDPVFSPLGDLLSLPALIPSLSSPTAQATFGFVAKCCAPTGNLEYDDHSMDVRIKAQSIDGLNISSPGISCPATPGSKHAQFAGTAAVIRPTGTTIEPFTVDVDDCGEPGTSDTFGIKTTTYANGPSVLIGGNIQIHQ
jgi:Right handed beta helix region